MLPFSTISERFDGVARYVAIYALIASFFILDVIALPSPFNVLMVIPFLNVMIYYWAAYRPTLLPSPVVFIMGLLADIMAGTPLGLTAVLLVLVHWAISDQRTFLSGQSFPMVWLVFIVVNGAVVLAQWLVIGLVSWGWSSVLSLSPQVIAAVVAFPLLFIILHLAHKILPSPKLSLRSR